MLIRRKRRDAILVEHHPEDLPGIAFQRRQASVEEQPSRHALVPIAAEQETIAGCGRGRRCGCGRRRGCARIGREVFQRAVEQIGEGDLIRWCAACLPWIGEVQVADNPGRWTFGSTVLERFDSGLCGTFVVA